MKDEDLGRLPKSPARSSDCDGHLDRLAPRPGGKPWASLQSGQFAPSRRGEPGSQEVWGHALELTCRSLGCAGEGVCTQDALPIFVPGALPGEKVVAEIETSKPRYAKGRLLEVIAPSPHRIVPPCPIFDRCGGCQIQHLDYEGQLEVKRQRVVDAFARIAKSPDTEILPCRPAPSPFGYRNKVQMAIRNELGFYSRNSHDLVPVEKCPIHCPTGEEVYKTIRPLILKSDLPSYCEATGEGVLRYLLMRSSFATGESVITLVTTGRERARVKQLAEKLMNASNRLAGVAESINRRRGNAILGSEFRTLAGTPTLFETVCGRTFQLSPAAFFQVNPLQAEALYTRALEWAELSKEETLLDAFCGVGTLAIIAADRVKRVIGMEVVEAAVEDARTNGARNGVTNATFIAGTTERLIGEAPPFQCALLNPPRKGCHPDVLSALAKRRPRSIVYLSCDPATLARDSAILSAAGYCVRRVEPFDMFPQTMHVESVAHFVLLA